MKVFRKAGRHLRICLDGTRNFARVKAGDTPEQHGLDIERIDSGLLEDKPEPVGKTIAKAGKIGKVAKPGNKEEVK